MDPTFGLDAMFACEGHAHAERAKDQWKVGQHKLARNQIYGLYTFQPKWNADASGDGD